MVLWLLTYHSDAAVAMFVITWLCLTAIVLLMVKKSITDPQYYVDRKVLDRTRQEIQNNRIIVRQEMIKNEIEALQRGERTPVLDVWRLDSSLTRRHPYFVATTALLIDPMCHEFLHRVQIGQIGETTEERRTFSTVLFRDVVGYLGIIGQDPYLLALRQFFETIVLQVDSIREDDRHVDVPFPVFSLLMDAAQVIVTQGNARIDRNRLSAIADIRFEKGNEIEPHRSIASPF